MGHVERDWRKSDQRGLEILTDRWGDLNIQTYIDRSAGPTGAYVVVFVTLTT